jgi:hypothetical protein
VVMNCRLSADQLALELPYSVKKMRIGVEILMRMTKMPNTVMRSIDEPWCGAGTGLGYRKMPGITR